MSTPNAARRAGLWVGGAVLAAVLGTAIPALAAGSGPATSAPDAHAPATNVPAAHVPAAHVPAAHVPAVQAPAPQAASSAATGPVNRPSRDLARLKRLVATLAEDSHGRVTVTGALGDEPGEGPGATADVRTRAGAFMINAWLEYDLVDGVASGAESCQADNESGDRGCTPLLATGTLGIWDYTIPGQPGRRELRAAASTKGGGTLMLLITNYTEQPSGEKLVGPNWKQAGISVPEVRAALAATGLTVR